MQHEPGMPPVLDYRLTAKARHKLDLLGLFVGGAGGLIVGALVTGILIPITLEQFGTSLGAMLSWKNELVHAIESGVVLLFTLAGMYLGGRRRRRGRREAVNNERAG